VTLNASQGETLDRRWTCLEASGDALRDGSSKGVWRMMALPFFARLRGGWPAAIHLRRTPAALRFSTVSRRALLTRVPHAGASFPPHQIMRLMVSRPS